jgi:hypothetical protein
MTSAPARGGGVPADVQWTPQRVLAGIRYHVIESGMAQALDARSLAETAARVEAEWHPLPPPGAHWAVLDDADRLHWLLQVSHTAVDVDRDGIATLRAVIG